MPHILIPNPSETIISSLKPEDFSSRFEDELSPALQERIKASDFRYIPLSSEERDRCILFILQLLRDPAVGKSGEHRQSEWERGWLENLELVRKGDPKGLIPRYFDKYDIVRLRGEFVKVLTPDFEYNMLAVIEQWLFEKYLSDVKSIYEFGCGTGHNLLRARETNPHAKLFGLDWAEASQNIIMESVKTGVLQKTVGRRFDFFHPDEAFLIEPDSGVYTVAALEQMGKDFVPFVEYLLRQKPRIIVHIEPMHEFLDEKNLIDYLAIAYYQKRNYLWGLSEYLHRLAGEKRIKIYEDKRTHIGHVLTDGYSVIVWSPV